MVTGRIRLAGLSGRYAGEPRRDRYQKQEGNELHAIL